MHVGASTNIKKTTADGLEFTYGTNFAGHFLLTLLLLKQGYFNPSARIVNVTSVAMYDSGKVDPEMVNSTDILSAFQEGQALPWEAHLKLYQRAKASQVVFTQELQVILARSNNYNDVTVSVCHPGKDAFRPLGPTRLLIALPQVLSKRKCGSAKTGPAAIRRKLLRWRR